MAAPDARLQTMASLRNSSPSQLVSKRRLLQAFFPMPASTIHRVIQSWVEECVGENLGRQRPATPYSPVATRMNLHHVRSDVVKEFLSYETRSADPS